jgi:hypothetical protein
MRRGTNGNIRSCGKRQAFSAFAFQAAKDRGEIPPETDVKFLLDLLYGYSVFRLITGQIDDDQIPDRIGATIAKIARSGVPDPVPTQKGGRIKRHNAAADRVGRLRRLRG